MPELLHGLVVQDGHVVGVEVHGDPDARVAEDLLDHLGVSAEAEQKRCDGVAEVVEAVAVEGKDVAEPCTTPRLCSPLSSLLRPVAG